MDKVKNKQIDKNRKYLSRKNRVNTTIKSNSDKCRLIVNKSNKFNYAQIIDINGKVIASANDIKLTGGNKQQRANQVGKELAKKAISNGITEVSFDRNGYLYHGRIKEIADGARSEGLKF